MINPTRFRLSITIRSVSNDLLLKSLEKLPLRSLNTKKKAIGIPAPTPKLLRNSDSITASKLNLLQKL